MAYRPYVWRKTNPEKRLEQKRREKVRRALRDKGILPPVGDPMNEEQSKIDTQISNNDFSYWDSIKTQPKRNGGKQTKIPIKDKEYILLYRVKSKCNEYGILFNLDVEDIVIPEKCEITSNTLLTDQSDKLSEDYYTLYMIDPSKGYVKGNVKVISVLGLRKIRQSKEYTGSMVYHTLDYTDKENEKSIYERCKENAKKRGLEFDLKKTDIVIPTHCRYLGIELSYDKKNNTDINYFSVDRIDNSKGYVKGNIQVISRLANTMKNSSTQEQLITFSENCLKIHSPQNL
jgi:hypothetical protein